MATKIYLDAQGVADRLGVPRQTIWTRNSQGTMPAPDAQIGRAPGWLPKTIDTWKDAPRPRSNKRSGRVV